MKTLLFKANYRQDPRMGFEMRKKKRYKGAKKFVTKMKEIQEEAKVVLEKTQEEMKKYTNRKRVKVSEYKVRDLVMLSTKNLKYQMIRRRIKSQLYYGLVVTYCMVHHYTKRAILARLFTNEGPAIYVVL